MILLTLWDYQLTLITRNSLVSQLFGNYLERHGFQILYRLGQTSANVIFRRESQLLKHKHITQRLGDFSGIHTPDLVRHLTYLLAYPTVEDVDGSYSLIVVAQKL